MNDWSAYPLTLRVEHIAQIYSLHPDTVRALVRRGDATIPAPFADRPYRFRRREVQQHYDTLRMSTVRSERSRAATEDRHRRAG